MLVLDLYLVRFPEVASCELTPSFSSPPESCVLSKSLPKLSQRSTYTALRPLLSLKAPFHPPIPASTTYIYTLQYGRRIGLRQYRV